MVLHFSDVNIEEFTIHVITSTLKSFFRELPEPLLTFELYDEFVQASGMCTGSWNAFDIAEKSWKEIEL